MVRGPQDSLPGHACGSGRLEEEDQSPRAEPNRQRAVDHPVGRRAHHVRPRTTIDLVGLEVRGVVYAELWVEVVDLTTSVRICSGSSRLCHYLAQPLQETPEAVEVQVPLGLRATCSSRSTRVQCKMNFPPRLQKPARAETVCTGETGEGCQRISMALLV